QLRAQVTLFGIARADEHEACGMAHRDAFALDDVLAGGGDVEEEVDEMVFEEVDLVYKEVAAVRAREQSGFVGLLAAGQRAFEIERADDAVLGGAQWQVDDGNGMFVAAELLPGG